MAYDIVSIDGVRINKISKRFPVEIQVDPHALNDATVHTGILDDNQIPVSIMRTLAHQNDPHTMIIDGRDVSQDGAKLDTIEPGAQVNNLTDQQAQSLTSGSHSSWHHHDTWYYRKNELSTSGSSLVHWNNLINVPATFTPSTHTHDDRYYTESEIDSLFNNYYTKVELNNGQLDNRYYTETEVDQLISAASFGISGAVETWNDLPTINDEGIIYIVKQTSGLYEEGFYRWSGSSWIFLANNTGTSVHNQTLGLNDGDYKHLTEVQLTELTTGITTNLHNHDNRYYTETEITNLLNNKSDTGHTHDDRYYTETEINNNIYTKLQIDGFLASYYTKTQLDNGQLDNRYYTETQLDNGQLDNRYYTETESDNKFALLTHNHDDRYYTKTELGSTSGAGYIGITLINGLIANNVQGALEELNNKTSNISSTLQDAYDAGKTITISTASVKIESTNTNSPLELTNRTTTPSTNLAAGQIAVIDNELYIYDGGRAKWLTPTKTLLFGKAGGADGVVLRPVGDSSNINTGYRMAKNGTIISATLQSTTIINKTLYIRLNGANSYTMNTIDGVFNINLNLDFNANDIVSVYVDPAGGGINETACVLEFGWRK